MTTTSVLTVKGWNLAKDVTVSITVLEEMTKSIAERLTQMFFYTLNQFI